MMTHVRLENVHTDEIRELGAYDFAQFTYEVMRVGPNGDDIATLVNGDWILHEDGSVWSDVILYSD
jgi:hypothetical protein